MADITVLGNTVADKTDWSAIETNYPILKPYLDKVDTKLDEVADKKISALSLVNEIINGFMWRRAAWALGGIVVCFVLAAVPEMTGNGHGRQQGRRGASIRYRTSASVNRSHCSRWR